MAEPTETFIGWSAVGIGVIIVYAAVQNKRPFHDIIAPALKGGNVLGFTAKPSATPEQKTTSGGTNATPVVPFGGATATGSQARTA